MLTKNLLTTSFVALLVVGAGCSDARESIPEDAITSLVPQPLEYVEWWNEGYDGTASTRLGAWGTACTTGDASCTSELDRLRIENTDPAQFRGGDLCSLDEQDACNGFLLVTRSSQAKVLRHTEEVAEWLGPIDSLPKLAVLLQTTHYRWRQLAARRVGDGWGMTFSDQYGETNDFEICVSREGIITSTTSCD